MPYLVAFIERSRSIADRKRILVIDGYGFRGLGSLHIIDRIVRSASIRAKKPLRPCDIFDFICGTSSGALIAILLGRLGLDCNTAIAEYKRLGKALFGEDEFHFWKTILTDKQVDSSSYDAALSTLIMKHSGSADALMSISRDTIATHTNTSVTVTSAAPEFSNRTHCIRSYDSPKGVKISPPSHKWLIREAARAASATALYISPLLIDNKYGFRDSAFSGFNNPIKLAQRELKFLWPNERDILTISLGTDTSSLVPEHVGKDWADWSITDGYCAKFVDAILAKLTGTAGDSQRPAATHIVKQVVSAAAETKGAHLEASSTLPKGSYHRIDPPLGLEKISFAHFFYEQEVEDAVARWADGVDGKGIIAAISGLVVEETKEIKVEDLRKLDPPPPPAVDDSGSMKGALWKEARDALSGIAEHALEYNAREIDMVFINSDRICSGVQGKDFILQVFDEVSPSGYTPTGAVLKKHLSDQLGKLNAAISSPEYAQIRPLDIIVLTDGCPNDKPEDSIADAVNEVKERKHHPNCIGIQFVQIGNDPKAERALQALSYSEEVGMVDTVLYDGALTPEKLERILLGGLHPNLRTLLQATRSTVVT
ncbi:hypothetical protein GALMADRAFT_214741 [Galerina marginata CBS 339.88]|uniref:PNPLA domain-containing protein n=1 Tax=Galerina marginata (strain CBS 339.88) TaxID=685588 RepID=A0A067SGE3_GALM3|nr:hypothetical protein GALMADRAFT_214741 [Galerina marginata CBS 339.88]